MPKPKSSRKPRGQTRSRNRRPASARGVVRNPAAASGRYTPPIPREFKESPKIIPYLMFGLLGLGMLVIIINYLDVMPGGANNWWLLAGLGCITAGFVVATKYR